MTRGRPATFFGGLAVDSFCEQGSFGVRDRIALE